MKGKFALYVTASFLAFITPLTDTLVFVGFLVACDFVTGLAKAQKNGTMASSKMIAKFYDSVGYFIGIIVASFTEKYFGDAIPMVKAVVAIIALTELQSLRENIKELTGTDILQPLMNILKKKSEGDK